jgi:alanine dehydrogenase
MTKVSLGIPKEIKVGEHRCAIAPYHLHRMMDMLNIHVNFESGAGVGAGWSDNDYLDYGVNICSQEEAWNSEYIVKVKEPQDEEIKFIKNQTLFGYFHLASNRKLTEQLLKTNATVFAFETLKDSHGGIPLLQPMSFVAGVVGVQRGSTYMDKLMCCLNDTRDTARVLVVGGGIVGKAAAKTAKGMGADVTIADVNDRVLTSCKYDGYEVLKMSIDKQLSGHEISGFDMIVGAVHIPGRRTPIVISKHTLKELINKPVMVDVAIDQGGCFETSRPTTHENPTYVEAGCIHYCVANLPGCVPKTSSWLLSEAIAEYVVSMLSIGTQNFKLKHESACNISKGKLVISDLPFKDLY